MSDQVVLNEIGDWQTPIKISNEERLMLEQQERQRQLEQERQRRNQRR